MLRTALLLLASASVSLAQVDDILANTAAFKPKISLTDNYTESVTVDNSSGTPYRSLDPNPERVSIVIVANLDGADIGAIDENTAVEISAGYFDFSDTLGDAVDYKPAETRATFAITEDVDEPNGSTRTVRVGSVVCSWTAKQLTITVLCTDVAGAGYNDIASSDYQGEPDPATSAAIVNDPIDVTVNFGDTTGTRTVFLNGVTRTAIRTFGTIAAGTYEEYDPVTVTLTGAADVAGPAVKAVWPLKPDTVGKITVSGTATDIQDVSLDKVSINGVTVAKANVAIADPDGTGTWRWSVTGLPIAKGTSIVAVTFSDPDGNPSTVSKTYVVK